MSGDRETETQDIDPDIKPSPVILQPHEPEFDQSTATAAAKDELQHHQQTYHLHSVKSSVVIRQLPALGLSFQLWPAAATLVSLIDNHHCSTTFSALLNRPHLPPLRILELGSGTGLVGIAAAAVLGAQVTVTDLRHVIPNLRYNAEANAKVIGVNGGKVEVAALRWGEEEMEAIKLKEYDMIIGSDLVYHDNLYEPLLLTLRFFLLGDETKKLVFVMAHFKRWKKENTFFKKATKDFDVEVIHRDDICNGSRVGVLVYTFVGKKNNKLKLQKVDSH